MDGLGSARLDSLAVRHIGESKVPLSMFRFAVSTVYRIMSCNAVAYEVPRSYS